MKRETIKNNVTFDFDAILDQSDDYNQHRDVFIKATLGLISKGKGTSQQFQEHGGWVQVADIDHPERYFVILGQTIKDRYYLNTLTGKVWRK